MGCDMHDMAEIRKNGKWEAVGEVYDLPAEWFEKGKTYRPFGPIRNYYVYGALAGVRRGESDGVKLLSKPRGSPDNASAEFMETVKQYGNDGHSHSWATLLELMEYDWKQHSHIHCFHRTIVNLVGLLVPYEQVKPIIMAWWEGDLLALKAMSDYLEENGKSLDDVRMVFFFDN